MPQTQIPPPPDGSAIVAQGVIPPPPDGSAVIAQGASGGQPGWLDKQIPLDSYTHATEQGLQTIGKGIRDAAVGTYNIVRHPIDTAKGIAALPSQVAQVPAAVSDINESPDPVGTYAKVAQETAGQGAGQALVALGTAGVGKVVPKVVGAVSDALSKDLPAQTSAAHANFMKAIPPTKTTPYTPDDLQAARPYLEDEHAGTPIQTVSDVKDAANSAISRIENKVSEYIRANPQDQISTSPLAAVQSKLAPTDALRNGFTQAGVQELAPYNLDQPMSVIKADAMRRQFNAENSAFEAKNSVDKAQARVTDPAYAAREAASQALRDGIYGKLEERGIPDVQGLRQDEGSIIAIRDAAQNQIFRGDQGVARTGSTSIPGRMARSAIQLGTTGGGAAIGGMVAGAPGAAGGGIIGAGLGEAINRVAFPGNLTRDALIEKSFSMPVTQGATLPDAPSAPSIRGLLKAPSIELRSPMESIGEASEPEKPFMGTTAQRKGLLLPEKAGTGQSVLPQPGYTQPQGEPIGTMIGSKSEPFEQPKGWPKNATAETAASPENPSASLPSQSANGRTGESTAVHESSQSSVQPASGARTNLKVTGTDQSIPAQYEVRELEDVKPFNERKIGERIEQLLNQGMGNKPLQPNVPLRDQSQ